MSAARLAALAILLSVAASQAAPASPCVGADADFAFWLGSWTVRSADGTVAGHNRISLAESGCRIDEHWRSAAGGTGSSINFRDPTDGRWEQVWHSPDGTFIRLRGGLLAPGDILLEGVIHDAAQGTSAPMKGRWTLLDDGRVRQFFEQQDEDGSWEPWFEGFYTRVDDAVPSAAHSAAAGVARQEGEGG